MRAGVAGAGHALAGGAAARPKVPAAKAEASSSALTAVPISTGSRPKASAGKKRPAAAVAPPATIAAIAPPVGTRQRGGRKAASVGRIRPAAKIE